MVEKIIAHIVLYLLSYLEKRMDRKATDADLDPDLLRRAGSRIDEWLRENSAGRGGKSDTGGK